MTAMRAILVTGDLNEGNLNDGIAGSFFSPPNEKERLPKPDLSESRVLLPRNPKNVPVPLKSSLTVEPAVWIFFANKLKTKLRLAKNALRDARLRMLRNSYLTTKASLAKADLNELCLGIFLTCTRNS